MHSLVSATLQTIITTTIIMTQYRSQYPTVVYMTFFPNDEIRKFFPGFDGTLYIQYHELKLINIVLSYTMPWQNINNLTK